GSVCNYTQWTDYFSTNPPGINLTCLTRGESIGMTITATVGLVSILSIVALFVFIMVRIYNMFELWRTPSTETWSLVRGPADIYMLQLLISDIIMAIGAVMDIRWIHTGIVKPGHFCTAQGIIQEIGEVNVAMTTGVIAAHTFVMLWWRKAIHGRLVALIVITCIWLYNILYSIIASRQRQYETPTPFWCWIGGKGDTYLVDKIFGEYLWLWITLLVSTIVYIPLFFLSRGYITVSQTHWWKFSVHGRQFNSTSPSAKRVSLGMLAYPITYSFTILPMSIVRWFMFTPSHSVPSVATLIVVSIFGLSGAANVFLLLYARPGLLLL
ncbi:hypothetical protein PUNSTDRAFT_25580, partial [Punctularia strigosozonata HHB-11173 SS5]|uniref:uncharacterized protein n=1 Tax=Punctularia strigosozonata (strain HHB-11173) TaxID=741275 RepID=UPI0004417F23